MGKKQHYIPRFILQNFADKDGLVWCLNKQTGKVFAKKPENMAYENYLYSITDKKDEAIEEFFGFIEGNAAPIIEKIIEARQFPDSEADRFALFCFIASFNLRYPALISALNNQDSLIETAEKEAKADAALPSAKIPAFMEFFEEFIAEKNRFYASNLRKTLFAETKTLIDRFDICLLVIKNGEFILSDEYKYFILYPEQEGRQERRAYMYYPIAPKICIILGDKELSERNRIENWLGIETFNRNTALKKGQFVFGSNKDILTKAVVAAQISRKKQRQFKKLVSSLRSGVSLFSIY